MLVTIQKKAEFLFLKLLHPKDLLKAIVLVITVGYLIELQIKQVMSLQNKTYIFLMFVFVSCLNRNENDENFEKLNKIESEINKKIPFNKTFYSMICDSIETWSNSNLSFIYGKQNNDWTVDSLICINKKNDKIITVIHKRCLQSDCKMDDIQYLYGAKILSNWYFFVGPTIVNYQEKKGTATSFEKLHEIAMDEVFSGYLIENKKTGEWEINEAFFADLTSGAWYDKNKFVPKTQADWDKIYLQIVANNWGSISYEKRRKKATKIWESGKSKLGFQEIMDSLSKSEKK